MGAMKSWMMDMEQTVIDVVAELPEEATEAQIINECSNRMHIIDKEYVKQYLHSIRPAEYMTLYPVFNGKYFQAG